MAIKRIEGDGRWLETADNPKDARDLHDKHGGALQKRGIEDFQAKFVKDLHEGFEPVYDPSGHETHMRRDRVHGALQSGYTLRAKGNETMLVPELPWQKHHKPKWGKTVYKIVNGELAEVT